MTVTLYCGFVYQDLIEEMIAEEELLEKQIEAAIQELTQELHHLTSELQVPEFKVSSQPKSSTD